RKHVCVVLTGTVAVDAANDGLPGSVTMNRKHRRTRILLTARVRYQQKGRNRHRALGVEHDSLSAVRTAIQRLGDLDIEGNRERRRPERDLQVLTSSLLPERKLRIERLDRTRVAIGDSIEMQSPVSPVREVAHALAFAHEASAHP